MRETITRIDDISGKNLKMLFPLVGLGGCPPGGLFVGADGEVFFTTLAQSLCKFVDNDQPVKLSHTHFNTPGTPVLGQTRSVVVR